MENKLSYDALQRRAEYIDRKDVVHSARTCSDDIIYSLDERFVHGNPLRGITLALGKADYLRKHGKPVSSYDALRTVYNYVCSNKILDENTKYKCLVAIDKRVRRSAETMMNSKTREAHLPSIYSAIGFGKSIEAILSEKQS